MTIDCYRVVPHTKTAANTTDEMAEIKCLLLFEFTLALEIKSKSGSANISDQRIWNMIPPTN